MTPNKRKRTSGQLPKKVPAKVLKQVKEPEYNRSTTAAHLFLHYSANIHLDDFPSEGQDAAIVAVRKIRPDISIDLNNPDAAKDFRTIQFDVYRLFSRAPAEVAGLDRLLRNGEIDGSMYSGECACLVGSLVNLKLGVKDTYSRGNSSILASEGLGGNAYAPAECFTMAIVPGDTPLNSWAARVLRNWIQEWFVTNHVLLPMMQAALERQEEIKQLVDD